jgi:hypothetical protein
MKRSIRELGLLLFGFGLVLLTLVQAWAADAKLLGPMSDKFICGNCKHKFFPFPQDRDMFATVGRFVQCPKCRTFRPACEIDPGDPFGFHSLSEVSRDYVNFDPHTKALAPVAKAFRDNLDRVLSVAVVPDLFAAQYTFHKGRLPAGRMEFTGPVEALQKQQEYALQELGYDSSVTNVDQWFRNAYTVLSRFVFSGLLGTMVIGAWTAFETLAGDLWDAAVNAHPKTLSELRGNVKLWNDPNAPTKSVAPSTTTQTSSDIGTSLRDKGKVKFQTVWQIRNAYASAFCDDFATVRDTLMNQSVEHLAAVRNILVHKAGIADQKFLEAITGCPHFAGLLEESSINLNGAIVSDLVSVAANQSVALISAVDEWLKQQPDK